MDDHSPGAVVCGEGFSSKNGIQFSSLFQAIFEPLQWVSNATLTCCQVREEDHLREARVVHPNHMSNPPPPSPSFAFMMSASMHGMLALRSNSVLESLSSQEMPITTRRHRRWNWSSFFCIAAKFHSRREGTALRTCRLVPKVMPCSTHTRVHNLPKEAPV